MELDAGESQIERSRAKAAETVRAAADELTGAGFRVEGKVAGELLVPRS